MHNIVIASCRNCKKIFNAKNALFCSIRCYKFYTDALEINTVEESHNCEQTEKLSNSQVLKYDQVNCNHEYSKNGTMSCRKCGHTSIFMNHNR